MLQAPFCREAGVVAGVAERDEPAAVPLNVDLGDWTDVRLEVLRDLQPPSTSMHHSVPPPNHASMAEMVADPSTLGSDRDRNALIGPTC